MSSNTKSISTSAHLGQLPKTRPSKYYFKLKIRLAIIKETSYACLFVLEYWLSNVMKPKYVIDDATTAKALHLSKTYVRDCRLKLQKANLFKTIKTNNGKYVHYEYCLGKEGVYTKEYFPDLFGSKYDTVSAARKRYTNKFALFPILDEANLSKQEKTDIYNLFDLDYTGEFIEEKVA